MRRYVKDNNVCECFESISELTKTLDARPYAYEHGMHRGDLRQYDESWCGYDNYDAAVNDMTHGLAEHVKALKVAPAVNVNSNIPRPYTDIIGYAPDVPAALMGIPENMYNIELTINKPVITLFVDAAQNCDSSTRKMARYGRKVVGYIKALESQNISVSVYCLECMGYSGERSILALKVKDASAPLDIKRLTFPLISAGMLRVIGFEWYEKTPLPFHYSCYGSAVSDGDYSTPDFIKSIDKNAVYINQYTNFERLALDAPAI